MFLELLGGAAASAGTKAASGLFSDLLGGSGRVSGEGARHSRREGELAASCSITGGFVSGEEVKNGTGFSGMPYPNAADPYRDAKRYANELWWVANYNKNAGVRSQAATCLQKLKAEINGQLTGSGFASGATAGAGQAGAAGISTGAAAIPWSAIAVAGVAGVGAIILVLLMK